MTYNNQNQEFETTIEKMERMITSLQECGYERAQAIERIIYDFEEAGNEFLAEYARANLS